eukprot:Gb_14237 [translate_table: standard]
MVLCWIVPLLVEGFCFTVCKGRFLSYILMLVIGTYSYGCMFFEGSVYTRFWFGWGVLLGGHTLHRAFASLFWTCGDCYGLTTTVFEVVLGFVVFLRRWGCLGDLFLEASPTAGQGRKLIGTFSATDLRGCPAGMLQSWLSLSVLEFTERSSQGEKFGYNSTAASTTALINTSPGSRLLVTCLVTSPLEEVISKAVDYHVHRVWVVDQEGLLIGLVALSDILRSFRAAILAQDNESPGNQP